METNATIVEVHKGDDGQFYWRAKAANGEIVATSEGYTRSDDATRAATETWPDLPVVVE